MKKNIGTTDKIIRIIIGLAIIVIGIFSQSLWGLIGLIPILTALTGRCLLYVPFGISTCKTDQSENTK
ncbi:MAG: DUF2892 domain-containing protein [Melioribacter sp.]|uniref:YgaP family membrane protein n=1 Tax=Rosettibacter primus TaxID=3111523 RepID=UPI00247E74ED|nr:DUF2892 domain-containing protein [Melioribacter sp.]